MNEKNLRKDFTKEERQENGRKGAAITNAKIAARKTLKQELLALLESGDTQNRLSLALIEKACTGDTKAFEVIRDTIGERPKEEHILETGGGLSITVTTEKDSE